MSLQFIITKLLVRLSGSKRITGLPKDKMLKQIHRRNRLNRFFIPKDNTFLYRDVKARLQDPDGTEIHESQILRKKDGDAALRDMSSFLQGQSGLDNLEKKNAISVSGGSSADFHCLAICHKEKPKRAILCVYGGGLLLAPPRMFVGFAKNMAVRTGADVWFPYYPLCDEYTIRDSVRMLYEVYGQMCREYEDIRWYGYSSGGALLILLGAYLNDIKSPLLMPKKLVLVSPGGVPVDEKEWQKMQALDEKDVMLSARYMKTIQPLLSHGHTDIPGWMQTCDGAALKGFPETWIYYGTSEVLSAKAEAYDALLTEAGVPHHMKMAEGMPHCYCVTVFFPEAKDDYEETMKILQE